MRRVKLNQQRGIGNTNDLRRALRKRPVRRLTVETLEDRTLLAVLLGSEPVPVDNSALKTTQFWQPVAQIPPSAAPQAQSFIHPSSFEAYGLNKESLQAAISLAPLEFTPESAEPLVISLPSPAGGFEEFAIVESPIMEPELAAQFPEIKTYRGQGIDDPSASLRFDITPAGLHAQVLSPSGAWYIDPYWHLDDSLYISYFKRDLIAPPDMEFIEDEIPLELPQKQTGDELRADDSQDGIAGIAIAESDLPPEGEKSTDLERSGTQLRTYRLANAASGEYTAFHGGTVALGQAAIVTAINRVTGIYEAELSVRLVLVANNSNLVYTNSATDPYTNNSASTLLVENQSNVDAVIGTANYDIGHVFTTGGGGLASLGVVGVNGSKARGETGLSSPIGDAFYVDYVAHEMGHQFGGSHTFNGVTSNCSGSNRNAGTAYEPGSGSTIQAYAGICGADNLQAHSDPYFHSVSFDQMVAYTTTGSGDSAAVKTSTGNNVPLVYAGLDYNVPARTPFVLEGAGSDADSADVLTFNWEERDLGAAQLVTDADNGTSPLFRSFNPTTNPTRILPKLSDILTNTTTVGEKLPTTNRALSFRATVRDNRSGGGGVNTDDARLTVVDTGAPFAVTSPNTAVTWTGGSTQTVTWNVSGTTAAPINAANVNILLSTDGGNTFGMLLSANTPNDGSQTITLPNLSTSTARIRVEAADNLFFDVSNANFTISGSSNTPPTISDRFNRLIDVNKSTGPISYTIGDAETAAANLIFTATSSNTTLVPNQNILISGSGAARTITVLPAGAQFGTTKITVSVTDGGGLTVQDTFLVFVTKPEVFSCSSYQNFDGVSAPNLPSGWTNSASGAAATNWITSASSSHSAPNNAFVANPGDITDSRLTSSVIAVTSANSRFKFRNNYNVENGFDGAVLEISINGGSFTDIVTAGGSFVTGGYNGSISTGPYGNPLSGRPAWTGNSSGYIDTTVDLPPTAIGTNVQLRWRFGADNAFNATGWRVDSIESCGNSVDTTKLGKIWDGGGSTSNWSEAANWSGDTVPQAGDAVVFTGAVKSATVDSGFAGSITSLIVNGDYTGNITDGRSLTLSGNLVISNSSTLNLNGNNLTVSGAFSNSGTVKLRGSEAVSLTQDTDSGTWEYVGNGDGLADTFTLKDFGAIDYFNLKITSTDNNDTYQSAAGNPKVIAGAFLASRGILDANSNSVALGSLAGIGGSFGNIGLGSGTLTTGSDNAHTTFAGQISGSGGFQKVGTGSFYLQSSNSYDGATTINDGSILVSSNNGLGTVTGGTTVAAGANARLVFERSVNYTTAEPVTINGAGFNSNGSLMGVGNATFAGPVSLGSASTIGASPVGYTFTLNGTINNNGNDLTFRSNGGTVVGGVISGGGGLIKEGIGTLTLSNTNTYTGTTTVNNGTVLVNGSISPSSATVNSNAILGGVGTIGSATASGGMISPGVSNSIGTLSGSSANFSSTGILRIQIQGYGTPGSSFDRLNLSGLLTAGGNSKLVLDLAGLSTTGTATGIVLSGSQSGTFFTVEQINNPNNYFACLSYNGTTSVDVTIQTGACGQFVATSDAAASGKLDSELDSTRTLAASSRAVSVANLDTGVDYTHPALYQNIRLNSGEIPVAVRSRLHDFDHDGRITLRDLNLRENQGIGRISDLNRNGRIDGGDLLLAWSDGRDDDGNGFVDDLIGWDFVNNDNDPLDDSGHGTHAAGIIVQVAPRAEILPLKFLDANVVGALSGGRQALDYALQQGVSISSNGWAASVQSQEWVDELRKAEAAGHLFVTAAGNGDPALLAILNNLHFSNVLTVAAVDATGRLASFSNWDAKIVDLVAPGVGVISTMPGGLYAARSGTSVSTAFVAGYAALLEGTQPGLTRSKVVDAFWNQFGQALNLDLELRVQQLNSFAVAADAYYSSLKSASNSGDDDDVYPQTPFWPLQ